jgi:hypothetical protein
VYNKPSNTRSIKLNDTQTEIIESFWDMRCDKFFSGVLQQTEASNVREERDDLTTMASNAIISILTKDKEEYFEEIDYYYSSVPKWQSGFKNIYNLVSDTNDSIKDNHPVMVAINDGRVATKTNSPQQLRELKELVGETSKNCLKKFIQDNKVVSVYQKNDKLKEAAKDSPLVDYPISCSPKSKTFQEHVIQERMISGTPERH